MSTSENAQQPAPQPLTDEQKDAERYRLLRRGQHWSEIDGIGDELRGDDLDCAIDRAIERARGVKEQP